MISTTSSDRKAVDISSKYHHDITLVWHSGGDKLQRSTRNTSCTVRSLQCRHGGYQGALATAKAARTSKKQWVEVRKRTILHVHHTFQFCTFLCRHCTITAWKCLIERFKENLNTRRRIFLCLFKLECSPQEINSWEIRLHLTYSANWNKTFAAIAVKTSIDLLGISRNFHRFKWECHIMMQIQYTMNLNPGRFELGTTLS